MNNRIIPITLSIVDEDERRRFEELIAANPMVRLLDEDADAMGVLIYEPGDTVDEDMPHIVHALESGQAEDVYLAGHQADTAVLIRGMRHGIREFIQYPVQAEDFRAAIMRTAMRASLDADDADAGKIIAFLGAKPGMGATTLATSLAWSLAQDEPGSTILVDLRRPYGETPYFLDLSYDYHWGHLMSDISRLDATYLQSVVTEHESGLHVLPGPGGEETPDSQGLYLILEQLRHMYAHVVVDTGYDAEGELPKELELADRIMVCTQLSLPALARTTRLMNVLRAQDPDADRRMKLVVNRLAKDSSIALDEAADVLGKKISITVPEDAASAAAAVNQGAPLAQAFPKSPASKVVQRMCKAVRGETKDRKKGFSLPFAGLFKRKSKADDSRDAVARAAS